jgi:adenosylhomocysteine nucleosidase
MSLPWFLRQLLENAIRQQVRRKVVEAARERLAAEIADVAGSSVPRDCEVAVVFALDIEAAGLEELLDEPTTIRGHGFGARLGAIAGRRVVVIRSGPGRKAARRATEAAIDGHRPKWVISAGFAGALRPGVERGDIVLADRLMDCERFYVDINRSGVPAELIEGRRIHVGPFLAVERIVCRPERKRELGQAHGALAVEMESLAVAEVCQRRGVPVLAVRAVTDRLDERLPRDVEHLMRQSSRAGKIGAALGAIMQRPGSLNDMLRLRETANTCSDHLAKYLAKLIERLP